MAEPPRIRVYVDGFNLYYGCLQGTPYRWLNVAALARGLLDPLFPAYRLDHIRYFTAHARNPESARQRAYLFALESLPNLSIHLGQFKSNVRSYPLADGTGFAEIQRNEEKGSDVNLASWLLVDAFDGLCDVALVVSNDSDLVLPIRMVRDRFPVSVGVASPCYFRNRKPSYELVDVASFTAHVTRRHKDLLRESQFPEVVELGAGRSIVRPERWAPS